MKRFDLPKKWNLMQRIILLLLAVAIGGVGTATAADLKTSGWIGSKMVYGSNADLGQLYPTKGLSENSHPQSISYTSLTFALNF